jgi:hypothetical protein
VKIAALIALAVALALAGAAEGQALEQRRPGLWELQYSGEDSESKASQAQAAERLRNMTPEKRARMEAYLKEHGTGMSLGPNGMPMMTMRFCLTPQDIADESGKSLFQHLQKNDDCTTKILTQSSSEMHITARCRAADGQWRDIDTRIYDMSPVHYSVDMHAHGARGDMQMHQQVRWVSSDCKGAF